MSASIGEYLVGAYLKVVKECDFIGYNLRPRGGGVKGLGELDVVGLHFANETAFLCEVTTHIRGILYKNNRETLRRVQYKYERQKRYADEQLKEFPNRVFMFWSPVVPVGYITRQLEEIEGLEVIINGKYAACVDELKSAAATRTNDEGNPAFRLLQILEHMRR